MRYPRAVVNAQTQQHILEAVTLANAQGCKVSVRSGGHSWAAWSVRDDAILIDLGKYQHISVDEERMLVEVSPSTTGRMLNGLLVPKGFMFPGGHCPDVGLGGFLLQGGMGWNCKNWGWACENIEAVDVVTAAGELLHCNAQQNQELYWMARGAGPGFPAIITKFHLRIRRSYKCMMASFFAWPMEHYREVLNWVKDIAPVSDKDNEIVAVSQCLPGHDKHSMCAMFLVFKNTPEEAQAALEPVNKTPPDGFIVEAINQPTSLAEQYTTQGEADPEGHRYCSDNAYVSNDADVALVLETAFTTLPHKKAFALYFSMNPCSRRKLPDMALSMQTDHYFALYTVWESERDDERCQRWVRDTMKGVEQHWEGAYLGDSDFQTRRTRFWEDENAKKLMEKPESRKVASNRCIRMLKDAGFNARGNDSFEWIHDTYLILVRMFPNGCPPTTLLSMNARFDPHFHMRVGATLRSLREEGYVLIGTGGAVHNLYRNHWEPLLKHRDNFAQDVPPDTWALEFRQSVEDVFHNNRGPALRRAVTRLMKHPQYRDAHATDDHFMAACFVSGAAGDWEDEKEDAGQLRAETWELTNMCNSQFTIGSWRVDSSVAV